MFPSLKSCVPRFKRLKDLLSDPMVELYLLFYSAVLPNFTVFNRFLQREDPCIYAIYSQLHLFVKRLLGKFVPVIQIKAANNIKDVEYKGEENQICNEDLFIGFATKQQIKKLLNDGDVDPRKIVIFYKAVRKYYEVATSQIFLKLPLNDELLRHAQFVDFFERERRTFSDVEFFIEKYSYFFSLSVSQSEALRPALQDKFTNYQLMEKLDIPETIWEDARIKVIDEDEEETYLSSVWMSSGLIWHPSSL